MQRENFTCLISVAIGLLEQFFLFRQTIFTRRIFCSFSDSENTTNEEQVDLDVWVDIDGESVGSVVGIRSVSRWLVIFSHLDHQLVGPFAAPDANGTNGTTNAIRQLVELTRA